MTDPSASTRLRARIASSVLGGVALLVTHDAIYLVQAGPGQSLAGALRSAGHGYWGLASAALIVGAVLAAITTALRMQRLRSRASALGARPTRPRAYARRFADAWWRLAAIVAIGFFVQENVEHLLTHGHVLGASALLGPDYPLAIPLVGLVSGIAAMLAAFVTGAHEALVVAIEAALRRAIRAPRVVRRAPARLVAIGPVLAHPGAGRAPPSLVVSAT